MDTELSIIIPMYNEECVVERTVHGLRSYLSGSFEKEWEIILVNDGSTDRTLEIAGPIAAADPRIRIVSYPENRGRGYALRLGVKNSSGRYVVITEADASWGIPILGDLYRQLLVSGADIVVASPYAKGGRLQGVPAMRRLVSWSGNLLLRVSIAPQLTMISGMTRGYRGDVIRALDLAEDGKEIHLEIIARARALGLRVKEIAATLSWESLERRTQSRHAPFPLAKLVRTHLTYSFYEAPLLLFGFVGLFCLALGSSFGLYLAYLYLVRGQLIGNRIVFIFCTMFLIVSGLQVFLSCFLAYQNKRLGTQLYRQSYQQRLLLRNASRNQSDA